jgi:ferredoxin-NADP reductase
VRFTAPDGYRAQRSYSIATAPGEGNLEITVELVPGGEVSSFIHEVVAPGDSMEIRGPIGGHFAWDTQEPALGIAGGSGVVPLMAMLRTARLRDRPELEDLVVSVRGPELLYYHDELPSPQTTIVYTRTAPEHARHPVGRIDAATLEPISTKPGMFFVCGSAAFCDHATSLLEHLGVATDRMRVERFGPSG